MPIRASFELFHYINETLISRKWLSYPIWRFLFPFNCNLMLRGNILGVTNIYLFYDFKLISIFSVEQN